MCRWLWRRCWAEAHPLLLLAAELYFAARGIRRDQRFASVPHITYRPESLLLPDWLHKHSTWPLYAVSADLLFKSHPDLGFLRTKLLLFTFLAHDPRSTAVPEHRHRH